MKGVVFTEFLGFVSHKFGENMVDDIIDAACDAWNRLTDMPWKIMSIATRDWAYGS